MKKITACILLSTYLCASCTSLLPILGDAISHLLWYEDHIHYVHHDVEDDAHVAAEIVSLLSDDHGYPASISESSGAKISLSAHSFEIDIFEILTPEPWHPAIHPPYRFALSSGVGFPVFMPPEEI